MVSARALIASVACLLACFGVAGCGGGGGGGGGDGTDGTAGGSGSQQGAANDPNTFFLKSVFMARPIFDLNSEVVDLVNPASLHEVDSITGVATPGFPKVLTPGSSLTSLAAVDLAQLIDPLTPQIPLVPRNAAIVLEMSKPVSLASLNLSNADPNNPNQTSVTSTVQVLSKSGAQLTTRVTVLGTNIVLHGVTSTSPGWPASPLVFDSFGQAVQDPTGNLRVVLGTGLGALLALDASPLIPRTDGLGTVGKPLRFNPGNSKLDAIVLQTEAGVVSFNGFLPDLSAPRIIRPVELAGVIDSVNLGALQIVGANFPIAANTVANGGLGEWASSLLEVNGLGGVVTRYVVASNANQALPPNKPVFVLAAGSVIDASVVPGRPFVVRRSEFFEPIPPPLPVDPQALARVTVDPVAHPRDPLDSQDLINHDLRYFVRVFDPNGAERTDQWDPSFNLFAPVKGKFQAISHKSTLRLTFNEQMDMASFRPYESFYVADLALDASDPGFLAQRIGRVESSADSRSISFAPFLENQFSPADSAYIGFGGTAASLKLVLRSIPSLQELAAVASTATPAQAAKLLDLTDKGVFGITDLGGRGLGLPLALLDQGDVTNYFLQLSSPGRGAFPPAIDFSMPFQTLSSADPDYRAIVHRFMGQATSSTFNYPPTPVHDTVSSGVEYADFPPLDSNNDTIIDRRFIYGPQTADIGFNLPGRLTGAPATVIQHLIDDFNKPKPSTFASPLGEDFLNKVGFGSVLPLVSPFGCRFQHIYRAGDASPAQFDYAGVVLDLVGLAWSPLANQVIPQTVEKMEILVGLSGVFNGRGPSTLQGQGIPNSPQSGLGDQFDCNRLEYTLDCVPGTIFNVNVADHVDGQPAMTTVVLPNTSYVMSPVNLFKPAYVGTAAFNPAQPTFNLYLNYPTFNAGIDPYFGFTNVFSFPYDSHLPMLIEYQVQPQSPENTEPNLNFANPYRFSPGIQTSVLPRFRVWSQGQHPLANCVPNFALGALAPPLIPPPACGFKAGEGGPLLEPGSPAHLLGVPAVPPNDMPPIVGGPYILPPRIGGVPNQTQPDDAVGVLPPGAGAMPKCNTDPDSNFYFANGMLAYPLPNLANWPTGIPNVPGPPWQGYGQAGTGTGTPFGNEPAYNCAPGDWGDNSRYYMMWQYRKRVSIIESPTIEAAAPSGLVQFLHPILDPPLSAVPATEGLKVEIRAGTAINFPTPALESGWVDVTDPLFVSKLFGQFGLGDRDNVKFRVTTAAATGSTQPPSLDTIVIPYRRLPAP
ncbi:MAG: hypothetical protein ACT4PU_10895 [Planctomycetota bacterium]